MGKNTFLSNKLIKCLFCKKLWHSNGKLVYATSRYWLLALQTCAETSSGHMYMLCTCIYIWETEIVHNRNDWPCWIEYMAQKKWWSTMVTLFLLWELLGALESEVIGPPKKQVQLCKGKQLFNSSQIPHIFDRHAWIVFLLLVLWMLMFQNQFELIFEVLWATVHLCIPMAGTINTIN
jgi:hypothetical protein